MAKNTNLSQEKSSHRRTPDRNEMVNAVPFKDRFLRGEAREEKGWAINK